MPLTQTVKQAKPVLVAVLDTGIDKDHEDLYGRVVAEIDLSGSPSPGDVYGHGTFIAGIIAADADNNLGVAWRRIVVCLTSRSPMTAANAC